MKKYFFKSVVFELVGVITDTASVHAKAWKSVFDEYLRLREKRDSEPFMEFTHDGDYLPFVDGKPRYEGVKSFLVSRGVNIPFGKPSDGPEKETICGIGNRKNAMFNDILKKQGAEVFKSSVDFIKALKAAGIKVGVASSSKNCKAILESAGIEGLMETRVDGVVSAELGLKGKPEGDIFVAAARNLGAAPPESVVVEDATSGVQAGRNGGFGLVLGIARKGNESDLAKNGADIVVKDLSEISIDDVEKWFHRKPRPLSRDTGKLPFVGEKKLVFFLDYDGTLTPIVDRPELAIMDDGMRDTLKRLSEKHMVAVVSGRQREDVEKLVGMKGIFYAGSHGFDIVGPGFTMIHPEAKKTIPVVERVIKRLTEEIGKISGVIIEQKKFSVAAHYRLVAEKDLPGVKKAVDDVIKKNDSLRLLSGKMVYEILPNIDWDKGKAIRWIMDALKISWDGSSVVYIGDDTTDEYAFRALRTRGTAILVAESPKESTADFWLSCPDEVKKLFEKIIASS